MDRFFIGLDLGQQQDYTAAALVEYVPQETVRREMIRTPMHPGACLVRYETIVDEGPPLYHLRDLWRFPLGMRYTTIVAEMRAYLSQAPFIDDVTLVIDRSGVGRGIYDMFTEARLEPVGISITSGNAVSSAEGGYHVAKIDLVSALERTMDEERLQVAEDLELREAFEQELAAFRRRHKRETANMSFGGVLEHDDLVIAVALAVWLPEHRSRHKLEWLDPEIAHMIAYGEWWGDDV